MKKSAKVVTIVFALFVVFKAGEHVGSSIGELIFNLTH
jgi:hypothetical protein